MTEDLLDTHILLGSLLDPSNLNLKTHRLGRRL